MADELTAEQLIELAQSPQSASSDGQSVSARSADDVLKLQNAAKAKTAATKAHRGLRFTKLVPPGTNP